MKVGVYVDGYNLYYGARDQCGRGRGGWRWLDIRALITAVVTQQATWPGAVIEKIVYCTARIDASTNPSGQADQDVYLKALLASGSVDHVEYGNYVTNLKYTVLAAKDPVTKKPVAVTADWPVKIQDAAGTPVPDARFMVSYLHQEEKGSDVNVASHLLLDTLSGASTRPSWSPTTVTCAFRSVMPEASCPSAPSTPATPSTPAPCAGSPQTASGNTGGDDSRHLSSRPASSATQPGTTRSLQGGRPSRQVLS